MYRHISTDDRAVIASMLRRGYTKAEIARTTGFHRCSIGREVNRNDTPSGYRAWPARHRATVRRKEAKKRYRIIETNEVLASRIERLLEPLVSPEVVAHLVGVHHQTIYTWIYRTRPDLRVMLPYHGKKRRRYAQKREKYSGWTKFVHAIDERIETNLSWEGDTVKGGTRPQLLTHVERTSLYTRADLIPDGTADTIHMTLLKRPLSGTITYDRGSEFALWRMIERDTGASIFFAHAHHPWERGKNENTNGRLRRVFPKRFDFSTITQRQLDRIVHTMNHTPRKSLSWRTPAEVYQTLCCSSG